MFIPFWIVAVLALVVVILCWRWLVALCMLVCALATVAVFAVVVVGWILGIQELFS